MAGQGRRNNAAGVGRDKNLVTILSDQTAIQQQMLAALEEIKIAQDMQNFPGVSRGPNSRMPYRGPVQGGPRVGDDQSERPDILGRLGYGSGKAQQAGGRGIQGIKNYIGNSLESRYGASSGASFTKRFDRDGNHIGYTAHHPDGSTTTHSVDEAGIDDSISRSQGRARASSLIGHAVEGGVISKGLKAVPVVGEAALAYEGAEHTMKMVGNQRAANAPYQAIYGGSNISQFGQRAQGEMFKLGQLWSGGLTGAMSEQAYQGVSQLGVGQNQKSSDLNFITSNYKSMGMSVSDSLNLITTATKNLNSNLSGLETSLKQVSAAAKATGQSGVAARALYASNYSSLSTANPGTAQGAAAGVLSTVQTSLGRNFAGVDLTGMLTSSGQVAISANQLGYSSPTALLGAEQTNPAASASVIDSTTTRIFTPFATSQTRSWLADYLQKNGISAATASNDPSTMAQISSAMQQANLINSYALQAALASASVSVTPDQATTLFVKYLLSSATGSSGIGATAALNQQNSQYNQKITAAPNASGAGGGTPTRGGGAAPASKPGVSVQTINGKASTVTDPVIANAASQLKGQNVVVQTKDGQRVVSISEAIKNYPDQIAKGTATLADTGQSIRDALGGESENNYQGASTTGVNPGSASKSTNSAAGMSLSAYEAKNNSKTAKTTGTVVISPSAQLLQLLTFSTTGNVSINSAAAAGTTLQPGTGVGSGGGN